MSGLFFLAMLIAIVWLAIWAALPRPWKGGGWWLFDMREADGGAPAEQAPTPAGRAQQPRGAPSRIRR